MPEVYHRGLKVKGMLEGLRTSNPLAAFAAIPDKFRFEGQEKDEEIVLLLRQHPVVVLPWVLLLALLMALPLMWDFFPWAGLMPPRFELFMVILWYLLTAALGLEKFLDWYFNVYVITDRRVVDVDFFGLIYKDVSTVRLESIQEVNYTQAGGLAAIFNFGDIFIQTAAERRQIDFVRVPSPNKVVEVLYQLQEESGKAE